LHTSLLHKEVCYVNTRILIHADTINHVHGVYMGLGIANKEDYQTRYLVRCCLRLVINFANIDGYSLEYFHKD
jgi:hypothetical protein